MSFGHCSFVTVACSIVSNRSTKLLEKHDPLTPMFSIPGFYAPRKIVNGYPP